MTIADKTSKMFCRSIKFKYKWKKLLVFCVGVHASCVCGYDYLISLCVVFHSFYFHILHLSHLNVYLGAQANIH